MINQPATRTVITCSNQPIVELATRLPDGEHCQRGNVIQTDDLEQGILTNIRRIITYSSNQTIRALTFKLPEGELRPRAYMYAALKKCNPPSIQTLMMHQPERLCYAGFEQGNPTRTVVKCVTISQ